MSMPVLARRYLYIESSTPTPNSARGNWGRTYSLYSQKIPHSSPVRAPVVRILEKIDSVTHCIWIHLPICFSPGIINLGQQGSSSSYCGPFGNQTMLSVFTEFRDSLRNPAPFLAYIMTLFGSPMFLIPLIFVMLWVHRAVSALPSTARTIFEWTPSIFGTNVTSLRDCRCKDFWPCSVISAVLVDSFHMWHEWSLAWEGYHVQ